MTVKELIAYLEKFPPGAPVVYFQPDCDCCSETELEERDLELDRRHDNIKVEIGHRPW